MKKNDRVCAYLSSDGAKVSIGPKTASRFDTQPCTAG